MKKTIYAILAILTACSANASEREYGWQTEVFNERTSGMYGLFVGDTAILQYDCGKGNNGEYNVKTTQGTKRYNSFKAFARGTNLKINNQFVRDFSADGHAYVADALNKGKRVTMQLNGMVVDITKPRRKDDVTFCAY